MKYSVYNGFTVVSSSQCQNFTGHGYLVNFVVFTTTVELLTGLSVAPKSAKMKFEGNKAKSIEIETYTRYDMIETSAAPIMIAGISLLFVI